MQIKYKRCKHNIENEACCFPQLESRTSAICNSDNRESCPESSIQVTFNIIMESQES